VIRFGPDICGDLEAGSSREWLETNGLGGFASSTLTCLNSRRYHGLLVAATRPPAGRLLLLAKLEETLVLAGRRHELGVNRYPGAVHPQGHRYLVEFRLDPFPVFTYEVEGLRVEKSVFMLHGRNATAVTYALSESAGAGGLPSECALELRPLIAFRDYHGLTHRNDALDPGVTLEPGRARVAPYPELPALYLSHDAERATPAGEWYLDFQYWEERARGFDHREDLFHPLTLTFDLGSRAGACVIASTEPLEAGRIAAYREAEVARRAAVAAAAPSSHPLVRDLTAAADQFLVARGAGTTVIAGYHWFLDWGRDTMISLPGLALVTGRHEEARGILLEFAEHVDQGMLPNRFPDQGEAPEYNTVDATLWFFEAVRDFLERTGDFELVRERLYPVLTDIVDWHLRGTRYGIRVDGDGLLASGAEGVQLTWMDAKVGDWVVTPRRGKPVEIQALWYNALRVMEGLAHRAGDETSAGRYAALARRVRDAFNRLFWNESAGCLYDVVDGEERDASIRPNQVLAASLPHSMLSRERSKAMLAVVERELLTPYGLRSLAPGDPRYRGRYEGDPRSRDGSYHQGTVWAWLMGPFASAYIRANGGSRRARERAAGWIEAFSDHLREAGLGQISEIADGDPPHTPRGCIAQAWSVAEVLRVAAELLPGAAAPPAASGRSRSADRPARARQGRRGRRSAADAPAAD
jgi:predicted glycogen debranching enzyme